MRMLVGILFVLIVVFGSCILGTMKKKVSEIVFTCMSGVGAILLLMCNALLCGYYTDPLREHKDWPRYALEAAYAGGLLMFVGMRQSINGVFHFHRYKGGCTCIICGKKRDKHHNWGHSCTCRACGKHRDESHHWDGCTCAVCGKRRDEQHAWNGCTCSICRAIRNEHHDYDCCVCTICGKQNPDIAYHKEEITQVLPNGDWQRYEKTTCSQCGKVVEEKRIPRTNDDLLRTCPSCGKRSVSDVPAEEKEYAGQENNGGATYWVLKHTLHCEQCGWISGYEELV